MPPNPENLFPDHLPSWTKLHGDKAIRAQCRQRVLREGLPHRRLEGWTYTDIAAALARQPSALPKRPKDAERDAADILIKDGFLMTPPKNLPKETGLEIAPLSGASLPSWAADFLQEEESAALPSLNRALTQEGVAIRVRARARIASPIRFIFAASQNHAAYPRLIVLLEKGAKLSLMETHPAGEGRGFLNLVRQIHLDAGAALHHLIIQEARHSFIHASAARIALQKEARYQTAIIAEGAKLARMEWDCSLNGKNADAHLAALILAGDSRHADVAARVFHKSGGARSFLSARAILGGRARGVFQAATHIAHRANQSDARQNSRACLLSPNAHMRAKPELAIYADDVKCAHGSAIGEMDDNALFYLRQRGLSEKTAKSMLLEAFIQDHLPSLPNMNHAMDAARLSLKKLLESEKSEKHDPAA